MTMVVFDVDGVLIDTSASFLRIVKELSGATDDDVARFKAHGGFNDDWELTRAARAWIAAGRPDVLHRAKDWRGVVELCGNDPGDQTPRCVALYRGGYWRHETLLVDGALLARVASRWDVAACTGRDRWELARAEELLGFSFPRATTGEDARKPDPRALLRLVEDRPADEVVVLIGDTAADRQCAERAAATGRRVLFYEVAGPRTARGFLEALLEANDVDDVAARLCRA